MAMKMLMAKTKTWCSQINLKKLKRVEKYCTLLEPRKDKYKPGLKKKKNK